MLATHSAKPWESPFHLWGSSWTTPAPKRLTELIDAGVITRELADLCLDAFAFGASFLIHSKWRGAGKTTLLDALLQEVPADRTRIYVRGCYEPFDFFGSTDPDRSILCVNEFSPHLPTYVWGPTAKRVFEAAGRGYQLAGTIHAETAESLVQTLVRKPLAIPLGDIAHPTLLINLEAQAGENGNRYSVLNVTGLMPATDATRIVRKRLAVANGSQSGASIDHPAWNDLLSAVVTRRISV